MLVLPIKKKWFDMIKSGEKKEESREIKPYYMSRFKKYNVRADYYNPMGEIILRNGYSKNSPSIKCKCTIAYDYGREDWGAIPHQLYYVIKILSIEEI